MIHIALTPLDRLELQKESRIAGEQLAELTEKQKAEAEYQKLLKSLDPAIAAALKKHIESLAFLISDGTYTANDAIELIKASDTFGSELRSIIRGSSIVAIESAKKVSALELNLFLEKAQGLLSAKNIPAQEVASIVKAMELPRISAVFGGGLDKEILDAIWQKHWPDNLVVDDRIKRLSVSAQLKAEQILKAGLLAGKAAAEIAKELANTLDIERRAAMRLAVHTVNSTYYAVHAETAIQVTFIMGVRITRGVTGKADLKCPICLEHGGTSYKDYFKDTFGGRNIDMWIMSNSSPYHSNCRCALTYITESAEEFIKNARAEYAAANNSGDE